MDCDPPGSFVHGDSPGENTGVVYHALLQGVFPAQQSNSGPEDPLEKEMAAHSSILTWEMLKIMRVINKYLEEEL